MAGKMKWIRPPAPYEPPAPPFKRTYNILVNEILLLAVVLSFVRAIWFS